MPLYHEDRDVQVAPEDAVVIVHDFVARCRKWALEREIPTRLQRVAAAADATEAAKLHAWVAYAAFLDHTLRELEDGTLDAWFGALQDAAAEGEPSDTSTTSADPTGRAT